MLEEWNWATRLWSGKHKRVLMGINLITLLWTRGDDQWACDFRTYNNRSMDCARKTTLQGIENGTKEGIWA